VCEWTRGGLVDTVSSHGAGGLVRHPVALSGLLLRWQSETLDYCCVENGNGIIHRDLWTLAQKAK
jgi:hypothetical protein